MREKPKKILIDFHVKLRVSQNSVEAKIYEYLSDESATPYSRSKLIIDALIAFYLPLVTKYHGSSQEQLEKALIDANYLWQWHFWYLQKSLGIDLPLSTFSHPSIARESVPQSSPFANFQELAQQERGDKKSGGLQQSNCCTPTSYEGVSSPPDFNSFDHAKQIPEPNPSSPLEHPNITPLPSPEIEHSNSTVIEEEEEEGEYPDLFKD